MSFESLQNNTCNISRLKKLSTSPENEFNELTATKTRVASAVPCRVEKITEKEVLESFSGGDSDFIYYVLYLPIGTDVMMNDTVEIIGEVSDFKYINQGVQELTVKHAEDAGGGQGHHIECICKFRMPINKEN